MFDLLDFTIWDFRLAWLTSYILWVFNQLLFNYLKDAWIKWQVSLTLVVKDNKLLRFIAQSKIKILIETRQPFQIFTSVDTDVRRDHAFNFLMVYHDHFSKVSLVHHSPPPTYVLCNSVTWLVVVASHGALAIGTRTDWPNCVSNKIVY